MAVAMQQTTDGVTPVAATAHGGAMIQLDRVNKWYGQFHVLRDVTIQVANAYVVRHVACRAL